MRIIIDRLAEKAMKRAEEYHKDDKNWESKCPFAFGSFQAEMSHLLEALNLNKKQLKILQDFVDKH